MKLIENWRSELNHVWVVRGAILTAMLGVSDQILTAFFSWKPFPPVIYSVLMLGLMVLRVLDQKP